MPTRTVDSWPSATWASESPTRIARTPAASAISAVARSYAVTTANGLFDYSTALARARFEDGAYWRLVAVKNVLAFLLIGSGAYIFRSAGVALANMYPEAKSVGAWLKGGWHVTVAYVIGFFFMLWMLGWHPDPPHRKADAPSSITVAHAAN